MSTPRFLTRCRIVQLAAAGVLVSGDRPQARATQKQPRIDADALQVMADTNKQGMTIDDSLAPG